MAGSKKKSGASNSGRQQSGRSKPARAGFSPVNHGLITVDREWQLSLLMRETSTGEFVWAPGPGTGMLGDLKEFTPLAARTHVRVSFVCSLPVYFTPTVGGAERQATRWQSGWIAVDNYIPFRLRAYGTSPVVGYWRVESAGVKLWEADLPKKKESAPSPADVAAGRVGVMNAPPLEEDDDDDD